MIAKHKQAMKDRERDGRWSDRVAPEPVKPKVFNSADYLLPNKAAVETPLAQSSPTPPEEPPKASTSRFQRFFSPEPAPWAPSPENQPPRSSFSPPGMAAPPEQHHPPPMIAPQPERNDGAGGGVNQASRLMEMLSFSVRPCFTLSQLQLTVSSAQNLIRPSDHQSPVLHTINNISTYHHRQTPRRTHHTSNIIPAHLSRHPPRIFCNFYNADKRQVRLKSLPTPPLLLSTRPAHTATLGPRHLNLECGHRSRSRPLHNRLQATTAAITTKCRQTCRIKFHPMLVHPTQGSKTF